MIVSIINPIPPNRISALQKLHRKISKYKCYILVFSVLGLVVLLASYVLFDRQNATAEEDTANSTHIGSHAIYNREDWGGQPQRPNVIELQHPTHLVIISHSATETCHDFENCASMVRLFQQWHFSLGSPDIGYNFVIGGDASIYVGRDWNIRNFHRGSGSIGINFIGDYNAVEPTSDMIDAVLLLIEQGVKLGKLSKDYRVVGQNQTTSMVPTSPGANIYVVIKQWDHFYSGTLF